MSNRSQVAMYRFMQTLTASIDRNLPITIALVFSRVAAAGDSGVLQATVGRELGVSGAALSRSVKTLSAGAGCSGGAALVARSIDGPDGRDKTLRLTEKGAALVAAMSQAIYLGQERLA